MKQTHRRQLEKLIGAMKCPKDFNCYKSEFKNLCKVKDFGLDQFLQCLEGNALHCKFSLPFGYSYFCQCPIRIYIAKKLNK